MSTLAGIVAEINSLTGYNVTTSSIQAGPSSGPVIQMSGYVSNTLAGIVSQINSLTGYNVPTASGIIISSSTELSSGSINELVDYVNNLTGFSIPYTSVTVQSGSITSAPIVLYQPTPTSGTIPTTGIYPGAIIEAEHLLRIINALNGINPNLIILSGSLQVTGSANFSSSLVLPFVDNENFIESVSGSMEGTDTVDGGSF
jgi:hypothetical protein